MVQLELWDSLYCHYDLYIFIDYSLMQSMLTIIVGNSRRGTDYVKN